MGRVFSFSNQQAGVGKTASCVNLAAALALRGKRVLAVDLSPDAATTKWLGAGEVAGSVYDVLLDGEDIAACTRETAAGIWLVPSEGLAHAEQELIYRSGREQALRAALGGVRGQYDYIFLDCPSSLGLLTINALTASDGVIVPVSGEGTDGGMLESLLNTVSLVRRHLNGGLGPAWALLTMYDVRAASAKHAKDAAARLFGECVFQTVIPRSTRLAESSEGGMPAIGYDGKCLGTRAYEALGDECLKGRGE